MGVLAENQGGKRVQTQGHPLKSFTVPAPPPISAPGTPQPKHIGKLNHVLVIFIMILNEWRAAHRKIFWDYSLHKKVHLQAQPYVIGKMS